MRYVVTINLGGILEESSRESFRQAASRWDADYIELMSGDPRTSFEFKRSTLFKRLPKEGRFVYVDADTLIHPNCPNLFDCVPIDKFGAISVNQPGYDDAHGPDRIQILQDYLRKTLDLTGATGPIMATHRKLALMSHGEILDNYINSGVMVFSLPQHEPVFRLAGSFQEVPNHWIVNDQGLISAAVCENSILHKLPPSFNRCGRKIWHCWTAQMDDFVWHFCNGAPSVKTHLAHTNWRHAEPDKWSGGVKVWENGKPIGLHFGTEIPFLYYWGMPLVKKGFHAVEIGAYLGGFTHHLLRMGEGQDALVESIDPFMEYPALPNVDWEATCSGFLSNVERVRSCLMDPPKFKHVREESPSALGRIETPIDLLIVDGNHTYEGCSADIKAAIPKMNKSGLIFVHDVCPKFPGVMRATSELLGQPLDKSHGDYCMAVYKVPGWEGDLE